MAVLNFIAFAMSIFALVMTIRQRKNLTDERKKRIEAERRASGYFLENRYAKYKQITQDGEIRKLKEENDRLKITGKRVRGYWIKVGKTEGGANILKCSICEKVRRGVAYTNYCKDCGARMEKEGE